MIGWQDGALALAGAIGATVAVIHGVIMDRIMVRPLASATGLTMSGPARRLLSPLLHFTTFSWLAGGLALIAEAWLGSGPRLAIVALVGSAYAYAAIANLRATRGRHPGGYLMVAAVALMVVSV